MSKPKLIISACLMGENVRYDGGNNTIDFKRLEEKYELFPFCPEVAGGLPTPRKPSEIISLNPLKLIDIHGTDVTAEFSSGASKCLALAKQHNITQALLKSNSPSCSSSMVYDGTFSGKLINGVGVTTMMLRDNRIVVFDETGIKISSDHIPL